MHSLYSGSLLAMMAVLSTVWAQKMVPTSASDTFPGCAISCAVLMQAQGLCIPPSVARSTQLSYDNCFCQSAELQPLYSTPDAICTGECTIESDRQLVMTWFTSFCKQVGQGIDPVSAGAQAQPTTLATTTLIAPTTTVDPTTTTSAPVISFSPNAHPSGPTESASAWFSGHWRWIVMIIVLFFGFLALGLLARWWKKRQNRKVDKERAAMSGFPGANEKGPEKARAATPDLWGPHQHMHASNGYEYGYEGVIPTAGGKGNDSFDVSEIITRPSPMRSKDRRARPSD